MDMQTILKPQDGKLFIVNSQDCTPIAEQTKALHNAGQFGSAEMRLAASIPQVIVEKYCNDTGVSFAEVIGSPKHLKAIAEHPDNAAFRVWKGRL